VWQLAPAGPAVSNGLVTAQDADSQPAPPAAPEPPQRVAADPAPAEPPSETPTAHPAEPAADPDGAEDLTDPPSGWPDQAMADRAMADRAAAARARLSDAMPDLAAAHAGPSDAVADRTATGGRVETDEATASNFPLWPDTGGSRSARPAAPAPPRLPRRPRRPAVGIPLLVVFALLAALFAWLGAEPAWLAAGHSDPGTVRITWCTGAGWTRHCVGDFVATGHRYSVRHVTVFGAPARPHTTHAARMVSRTSGKAYLGDRAGLTLRWAVPLALVLLCGLLIALATGAWRLPGRDRATAVSISLFAPLVIAAGILAVAW
jgi:hypothetical protein